MEAKFKTLFRRNLLQWYQKNKRDLPWRRTRDPYAIWVSEIMLQQTQVATVIPYYKKFLRRFPNLGRLAGASEEEVLSQWSGLGYYRRAKLLHRGTQAVKQKWKGRIPRNPESLLALPGIGRYTAGAIASIAFDREEPLVDGNVIRVLSRVFAIRGHAKDATLQKKIWTLASQLVTGKSPGDFNQGLMELGATVCRPVLPQCPTCPMTAQCRAFQKGNPEAFPESPPTQKTLRLRRVVGICERRGKILLVKRKHSRWFQGMWELPHAYLEDSTSREAILRDFLRKNLGVSMGAPQKIKKTLHGITHHRIESFGLKAKVTGRIRAHQQFEITKFFEIPQMKAAALSNFDRKVLQAGNIL